MHPEDVSELGHWTSLSDGNLKKFKQFELAWKYSGKTVTNPESFNTDRAWKKWSSAFNGTKTRKTLLSQ